MNNWINTGFGIAGAGLGMAYYYGMRRNVELDRQLETAEIEQGQVPQDEKETEVIDLTVDENQETGNEKEVENKVIQDIDLVLKSRPEDEEIEEMMEIDDDELTEEDVTEIRNIQSEMEVLLQYLEKQKKSSTSMLQQQQPSNTKINQKNTDLTNQNFEDDVYNKGDTVHSTQSDLEFSDFEPEPPSVIQPRTQDPPTTSTSLQGCSTIFWPFKIFPSKYSKFVVIFLFCVIWSVCAMISYHCLSFVYYQYETEKSCIPKIAYTLFKWGGEIDNDKKQLETEDNNNEWHW